MPQNTALLLPAVSPETTTTTGISMPAAPSRLPTMTPEQLRAARGLLDWSRGELSLASGLSLETIKNIEHGIYTPKKETVLSLVTTFNRHGIQFVHYETLAHAPNGNTDDKELRFVSYCGAVRALATTLNLADEDDA